jgi:hypothetical protein
MVALPAIVSRMRKDGRRVNKGNQGGNTQPGNEADSN